MWLEVAVIARSRAELLQASRGLPHFSLVLVVRSRLYLTHVVDRRGTACFNLQVKHAH